MQTPHLDVSLNNIHSINYFQQPNQEPLIEMKVLRLDGDDRLTVHSEDGPLSPYGKRRTNKYEQTSNGLLEGYKWRNTRDMNMGTTGKNFFDDAMQTSAYSKGLKDEMCGES
jgi:hypothetical protein